MARILSERLKSFLDGEILIAPETPQECLLQAARACIGIKEDGGDNRGLMVEAFQVTIGGAVGESWCVSFIQALIAYVEDRMGVICDLYETEHVLTLWNKSKNKFKFTAGDPLPGDIVCWQYGGTDRGHAEIIEKAHYKVIETIGGNTSPSGIVDRNGDGVYAKIRSKSGTSTMQMLGYIRPAFKKIA